MNKKTIQDIDVTGKRVLVRVDFNVPLSSKDPADTNITVKDDTRIVAALPTINALLAHNAVLILTSHLGRPKSADDAHLRMGPVARRLSELLGRPVQYVPALVGPEATAAVQAARPGDVLLLENSRFEKGETKNDPALSAALAELADIYVNDAFGSAHRAHATTAGIADFMRAKGAPVVTGFLMGKEIEALGTAVHNPPRPYIAIMGGAKISDKVKLIESLLNRADKVLIGGGMANTFLRAQGYETGSSLVEEDALPEARRLLAMAPDQLVLPVDVVVTETFSADAPSEICPADAIPAGKMALDIGPESIALFKSVLDTARLVVWNGPMGVFEFPRFSEGTFALAHMLADAVVGGTQVIIGGGDSAAAVNRAGLSEKMTHVSTGGGASLEMLEGQTLPGIAVLDDRE
jgi:phosphoglycerate kinase